jgi:hypothetical protein
MHELRNEDWLEAVLRHPATTDTDLSVAAALLLTGSANGVTKPSPDGPVLIAQDVVDESMTVLVELGFLETVVSVAADGGEDFLLALRMPVSA